MSNEFFENLSGKKVTLEIVSCGEDVTVEFVDSFGDYKVRVLDTSEGCDEVIKIKIVEHFAKVKLEKVSHFEDYEIYFK